MHKHKEILKVYDFCDKHKFYNFRSHHSAEFTAIIMVVNRV